MELNYDGIECICGRTNSHTRECKHNRTRQLRAKWRKERRKKLMSEHKCIWCMKEVEPVITYPQLCEEHRIKQKVSTEKIEADRLLNFTINPILKENLSKARVVST